MNGEDEDDIKQPNTVILNIAATELIPFDAICRICGNNNGRTIGIYDDEGNSHELAVKMNMYLPIKVAETDELPLRCCWTCASTVLAWHEFVVGSVEADRKLKDLQILASKTIIETREEEHSKSPCAPEFEAESTGASLSVFYETTSTANDVDDEAATQSPQRHQKLNLRILKPEDIQEIFPENAEDDTGTSKTTAADEQQQNVENVRKEEPKKVNRKRLTRKSGKQVQKDVKLVSNGSSECSERDDKLEMYHFACQYCSFVFINEEDIVQHVKEKHPDEIDLIPSDPLLDKKEKRKHTKIDQDAVNAAKIVVDGRVYYNCKVCGKSLHSPYTYMWHMRIHTGERPYVCDLCGKQFRVSQGLVRHLRETHEGIKNFPCDLCGRMFATRRNVEEHRRIHTNERPYICDLCGKAFKQKASLFVHNRSHSDYFPYRCSYCNQRFRTRPPLLIHVTRHTGEKPYPCDVCGRCFRIKYELKRHRLVHSDEKPFSCVECGLSFRQKRYLRNHNKTNHNRLTP